MSAGIINTDKSTTNEIMLSETFKIYMDIYKNHHGLYIKATSLYFTVVGVVSGYMSSKDLALEEKRIMVL